MQANPKLAIIIQNSYKQDENNPFLFLDDEQIDIKILWYQWFVKIEMDVGCRSSIVYLLLYYYWGKDLASSLSLVYFG